MTPDRARDCLAEFMRTRDQRFRECKFDILEALSPDLPGNFGLHDHLLRLLWVLQDDYTADQVLIDERVTKPFLHGLPPPAPQQGGPRLCFLSSQMQTTGAFANGRTLLSALEAFVSQYGDDDVLLYVFGKMDCKSPVRVRDFSKVADPFGKVCAIREAMALDGVGMAVAEGYWGVNKALYRSRCAPVQTHWSMGYSLASWADHVFVMDTMTDGIERLRLPSWEPVPFVLAKRFLYRDVPADVARDYRRRFGLGKTILGTVARLEKIRPPLVELVKRVLAKRPAEYVAFGSGSAPFDSGDGLHLGGHENTHLIGNVIDIALETWPLCGCQSAFEAMAHGVPVVHMAHEGTKSYRKHRRLIATSEAEYEAIVLKLIDDPDFYRVESAAARRIAGSLGDDMSAIHSKWKGHGT